MTNEKIQELVDSLEFKFSSMAGTTMTICAAILPSGFIVATGQSACVDPANYDQALGEKYAKEDAIKKAETKLWEYEGYCLSKALTKRPEAK